ncbi:MAG TPA: ABC transporter permease [Microbacteriaceae bacterium]|nr:ABC transporter permease [Microbacteriaceae bacterium]
MSVSETRHIRLPRPKPRIPAWLRLPLEWFAFPIIIIGIWSLISAFWPDRYFPAPAVIGETFADYWLGEAFVTEILPSLGRLGLGIVISIVVGLALGVLVGSSKWLRELLEPIFEFFRAVPPPMIVPLLIMVLGSGDVMKVAVIATGAMWPILLNTIEGVRAVDQVQRETVTSFRLPRAHRLLFITLPSASPQIMTGIRQSLSVALILMVISEMFFVESGIGLQIEIYKQNYLYAAMWGLILLLGLIGVVLAVLFQIAERYVLAWYRGLKEAERA